MALKDGATKLFVNTMGTANDVREDVKASLNDINGVLSDDAFVQEIDRAIRTVKTTEKERVGDNLTFFLQLTI